VLLSAHSVVTCRTLGTRQEEVDVMTVPSLVRHVRWLALIRALACILAFLIVPFLVGVVNLGNKFASAAPVTPPTYNGPLPNPTYDPTKRVAVIVASSRGAEITDALPTFEILSRSGAFNVYIVAPQRTVLPFGADADTGLDFIPHFSYAGYDAAIGNDPDLIALPYSGIDAATGKAPELVGWVRAHAGPRTTLLGICVGSSILAETGLLDGHQATTNNYWFERSAQAHPAVHWVHDVRYVDDDEVITSTNLASGVDATLHAVSRLVGRSVAEAVARQLGYTHTVYLDDPHFQAPAAAALPPLPLAENNLYEWPQERLGVLLSDGVSEFALAAVLDTYTVSMTAKTLVFAPERAPIVARDGLVLVPRYDFASMPALGRVVVPAGNPTAARQQAIAAWNQLRADRPV
jgi:transcriptional regulator GlxA family with amidase domain